MSIAMRAADFGGPDQIRPYDVEVAPPATGEVTISVRVVGMNPADHKMFSGAMGSDESALPLPVGYEVAGVLGALGDDTEIASGGGAVGDAVIAFRVAGGYAEELTVPASDVYAKPDALDFPEAANLFLVGCTAADMLRVVPVEAGQTVVVHAASGAVGVSLLQQLAELGVTAVGTCGEHSDDVVRRFGGTPVTYGDGLLERLQEAAPEGYAAAYDCIGTDEAIDASLALVGTDRLVTVANQRRAQEDGFIGVGGRNPESADFRRQVRPHLLELAATGRLVVPMARTYPLADAAEALAFLAEGHPGGKLALIP